MSIFSLLRRGRQAAKEHSPKQAQENKQQEAKPRYRHIPKHAAIDALSGGPPSHRESDRPKIQEHNRIRSSLTANGIGMAGSSTGSLSPLHHIPRTGSSLSFVSYPSPTATPIVRDSSSSSSSSASSSQDESSPAISVRSAPRRKMSRKASDASLTAAHTAPFRPASFAMLSSGPTPSPMQYGAAYTNSSTTTRSQVPVHLNWRSMTTAGPSNELEAEPLESPMYKSGPKERRRRSTIISGLPMEFDSVCLLPPAQELVVPVEVVASGVKRKRMWSMRGARRRVVEV
ncbi:hypothetical protein B0T18DRAFT_425765 [Schizothecium vesticola]|uniref:Uncharacterized protein n=1 Tax=Schizothecium vesticola TaxID=314040 RepID=A0AA40K9H9_9PEZI|nr:hypothetical protein B0T18DRAFT_425765 [Schizothecium vesticola]